jgi:hypothetical protein
MLRKWTGVQGNGGGVMWHKGRPVQPGEVIDITQSELGTLADVTTRHLVPVEAVVEQIAANPPVVEAAAPAPVTPSVPVVSTKNKRGRK